MTAVTNGSTAEPDRTASGERSPIGLTLVQPASEQESDASLLARMGCGDLDALSMLYDRHAAMVFGLVQTMLGEGRDAEAVTQKVFIALWRLSVELDRSPSSVRGWLVAGVYRQVLEHIESSPQAPCAPHGARRALTGRPRALLIRPLRARRRDEHPSSTRSV